MCLCGYFSFLFSFSKIQFNVPELKQLQQQVLSDFVLYVLIGRTNLISAAGKYPVQ
jgi:hypothetical protein